MGMALICGYLAGSLQGLLIENSIIIEGASLTTSLTSLLLSMFLVISRGSFRKNDIKFLLIIALIPFLFTWYTYVFSDYYFIYSEFKKFLFFIVFLTVAITFEHEKIKDIIYLSAHAIFGISLVAILAFNVLGIEFNYGGTYYAVIPASILLLPILHIIFQSRVFLFYSFFIVLILALGFLQPSAKLIVILSFALLWELRRVRLSRIITFAAFALAISLASLELDDIANYKIFSLISSLGTIPDIISAGAVDNARVFFYTSAGNIIAEFFTVLGVLASNSLFPLGVGFSVPDLYGWLSFANDAAYDLDSTPNATYPLHLGFYYLLLWYGPLIIIFNRFREVLLFLIIFSLFALSTPSLIFLSAILTPRGTENMFEIIQTDAHPSKKNESHM